MIIFFGGFEIAVIIFVFIAIIAGSAKAIIDIINVLVTIFVIKNLIQTLYFGCIKNKNSIALTAGFLVSDFVRVSLFFYNLKKVGLTFTHSTGLAYFGALFGFILYFIICGSMFLLGEFLSLMQSFDLKNRYDLRGSTVLGISVMMNVCFALVIWAGYQ